MKVRFLKDGESPDLGVFTAGEVREVGSAGEALIAYGIAERPAEPRPAARTKKEE